MKRALLILTSTWLALSFCGSGGGAILRAADTYRANGKVGTTPESVVEDIGDIRPIEEAGIRSYFHGNASVRGNYTSNARLQGDHGSSDFLTMPTLEGGLIIPMGGGFTLNTVARAESVIYSSHDERGIWGFSGEAAVEYRHQPAWPRIYAGMEPYYYNSFDTGDRVAAGAGFVGGIDQGWPVNRGRSLITAGYRFGTYLTSPEDDRNVHRLTASYTHQFRPELYGQIFYQWQYSAYTSYDRDDSRHIVGLNFIYQITANVFGSLNSAYVDNNSTRQLADYSTVNAGLGVTWQF